MKIFQKNIEIELKDKRKILKGYDVFGKTYGYMLRNDLHDLHFPVKTRVL